MTRETLKRDVVFLELLFFTERRFLLVLRLLLLLRPLGWARGGTATLVLTLPLALRPAWRRGRSLVVFTAVRLWPAAAATASLPGAA